MKKYECDACNKEIGGGEPDIKLSGIAGTSGGILLPGRFQEKHFCCEDCFRDWMDKYIFEVRS